MDLKDEHIVQWGPIDVRPLFVSWFYQSAAQLHEEDWDTQWCPFYTEIKNNRLKAFYSEEVIEQQGFKSIEQWIKPREKRNELWSIYEQKVTHVQKIWEDSKDVVHAMEREELAKLMRTWGDAFLDMFVIAGVVEIANFGAPTYLKKELAPIIPEKELDHVLEALLAPEKPSFHQQAELDFLKMMHHSYGTESWDDNYQEYLEQWHWVDNSYYEAQTIDTSGWIEKYASAEKKVLDEAITTIQTFPETVKKRKETMYNTYNIPQDIQELAYALSFSIWWQDHRKALLWWGMGVTDTLARRLSALINMPFEDMAYYNVPEWYDLAERDVCIDSNVINHRRSYLATLVTPGEYREYYEEEADAFITPYLEAYARSHSSGPQVLTGTVACRAEESIIGTVRVVESSRNAVFEKGEILVTPMTSPDFIHLMRDALAIITDIGGLMSHAAVVSRELNKPCIIGTKRATELLHTGDRVEIDTETGTIRII